MRSYALEINNEMFGTHILEAFSQINKQIGRHKS